jgi:protein-L-isoaspartate(D-aspartate) O-methyltransferase
VTAAAGAMPVELLDQLAIGGRMIIPVGTPDFQELKLVAKTGAGEINVKTVELVRFVELKGRYGWT